MIVHVFFHVLEEAVSLLPFLFITYVIMEILQRAAGERANRAIKNAGKVGPIWGGLIGAFPQCGFSAAASYFYVGRVITLGTLISVYMSTSDEMLPILISEQVPGTTILKILLTKVVIGMISGFIIEFFFGWLGRRNKMPEDFVIHNTTSCNCKHGHGILMGAATHTLQVWVFIFIISYVLGLIMHSVGSDALSLVFSDIPVLGEAISGLVGLIPNCAASVVITQLYLDGVIGAGPMISGLLVSAGVGLLVLFRENHHTKENFMIVGILYVVSVGWGVLIDILGITF